jgi:hypothetical protein
MWLSIKERRTTFTEADAINRKSGIFGLSA